MINSYFCARTFAFAVPAFALLSVPAHAQSAEQGEVAAQAPSPEQVPSTVTALPEKDAPPPTNPYKRFDDLSLKGWIMPFPKVADSVLQDAGGVRSALADAGVGIFALSTNRFVYNVAKDGISGRKVYNGQEPTYNNGLQAVFLTYDLGKIGIDNGQFFIVGAAATNGLERINGPRTARIANLGYYQTLANGHVELKIGYFDNSNEYVGPAVGGSIAGGSLGPTARIPVQVGFGYAIFGTPAINVRLNADNFLYTKFGIQRSIPPGAGPAEYRENKGLGLRFSVPDAKVLFVDEVGFNRPASPGRMSTWIRGGAIYNTSNFKDFRTGANVDNWAVYLSGDRQLTQPDRKRPFRGLYAGASFNYAPTKQNLYSQYYEARLYGVGLIESRPFDLASVVATYNRLSSTALRAIAPGLDTDKDTASVTASYAYRFHSGIYLQPGLGLTYHSTYYPKLPLAVNLNLAVTFLI